MNVPKLAKAFLRVIEEQVGPFDRPIEHRVFPFDAGGALSFLTVGKGRERVVRFVSWDLFGHPEQKRGALGRYEFVTDCDDEEWCLGIVTKIARQSLLAVFDPGDTLDIGPWVGVEAPLQGVVFEEMFRTRLRVMFRRETCGLLRCIGVTRPELEFAMEHGVGALLDHLRAAQIYPHTIVQRESINLA